MHLNYLNAFKQFAIQPYLNQKSNNIQWIIKRSNIQSNEVRISTFFDCSKQNATFLSYQDSQKKSM